MMGHICSVRQTHIRYRVEVRKNMTAKKKWRRGKTGGEGKKWRRGEKMVARKKNGGEEKKWRRGKKMETQKKIEAKKKKTESIDL